MEVPAIGGFMKSLLFGLSVLVFLSALQARAVQASQSEVTLNVNSAFIPSGFDSSSDAFVVVNGILGNSCYKWKGAEVVNKDQFTHEIRTKATVTHGMCAMILILFQKEVRLGKLAAGKHTIRFLNGDGTYLQKEMVVE
jgi:hypothetical protein